MPALSDTKRFFQKLTWRKATNAIRVYSSYYVSRWRKKPILWGVPFSMSVEPTTACNLRCPECPSGLRSFTRDTGNIKSTLFEKIINENYRHLLTLMFYFQGEPYIHPAFLEMVAYAHSKKIYTITSTNGHFLNDVNARRTIESGLNRLIISVDGTTQEVYEQYRKMGKLDVVLQGARNMVKWKNLLKAKHPHIVFQFLVVRPNEHQISEIFRLAKEIGIDEVKLKTAQVYEYSQGNSLIPTQDQYARYRKLPDGTWKPKHSLTAHCWKLWHGTVITWNGIVLPCCFDKDADHGFGNIASTSLSEILHEDAAINFRNTLFKGRSNIDICKNCSEGCKVWS
jgi:radical SAM protein with 4Fe4S-binding SPASM domain